LKRQVKDMANLPQGKTTLPERAIGAPALANLSPNVDSLAIAWTGTDPTHHLNVIYSDDGKNFSGKVTINETSIAGPGLAFSLGNGFIAWTGADETHHVNVGRSPNPTTFAGLNKVTLNETSPYGPALAFGNNQLFLAWTGTDEKHSLNVISSSDGITFSNKVTLGETSGDGPSLLFIDKLYLLWSGTDENHSLNIMQSADGIHFTNKITLSDSSDFHPGLVLAISGSFYLAWTGRDAAHSLNTLHTPEFSTSPTNLQFKQTYSESSIAGVGVAPLEAAHELFVAWTGSDSEHHLNVAIIGTVLG
jgi:hypothetical protein